MSIIRRSRRLLHRGQTRTRSAFDDENLDLLSHLLDDFIRIPGTSIRFGLDGIVGLIPGVGDLLADSHQASSSWRRGRAVSRRSRLGAWLPTSASRCWLAGAGRRGHVRYRLEGEPPQLCSADRKLGGAAEARAKKLDLSGGLCALLLVLIILPLAVFSWLTAHFLHGMLGAGHHGFGSGPAPGLR